MDGTTEAEVSALFERKLIEMQNIDPSATDFRSLELPLARIKKIMKIEDEVQSQLGGQRCMVASEAPVIFAKACEIFILELTQRSWTHTEENKRRTLQRSDVSSAVSKKDMYDFLIDIVPRDDAARSGEVDDEPSQFQEHAPQHHHAPQHCAQQQAPSSPLQQGQSLGLLGAAQAAAALAQARERAQMHSELAALSPPEEDEEQDLEQDVDREHAPHHGRTNRHEDTLAGSAANGAAQLANEHRAQQLQQHLLWQQQIAHHMYYAQQARVAEPPPPPPPHQQQQQQQQPPQHQHPLHHLTGAGADAGGGVGAGSAQREAPNQCQPATHPPPPSPQRDDGGPDLAPRAASLQHADRKRPADQISLDDDTRDRRDDARRATDDDANRAQQLERQAAPLAEPDNARCSLDPADKGADPFEKARGSDPEDE